MTTPFFTAICIALFNLLWFWNKYTLIQNGYNVSWFFGFVGDVSKMFHLARVTQNRRLKLSYMIRGWLWPLSIPIIMVIIFNTIFIR